MKGLLDVKSKVQPDMEIHTAGKRDDDGVVQKLTFYQAACSPLHHSHNPYRAVWPGLHMWEWTIRNSVKHGEKIQWQSVKECYLYSAITAAFSKDFPSTFNLLLRKSLNGDSSLGLMLNHGLAHGYKYDASIWSGYVLFHSSASTWHFWPAPQTLNRHLFWE